MNVLGSALFLMLALSRKWALNTSSHLEETKQRVSEQKNYLQGIFNSARELIFVKDWDGNFQIANEALADFYDTTPEKLLGQNEADINPNVDEVEGFLEDDREVMRSEESKTFQEQPVTHLRTGETHWFHTTKVPLFTDKPLKQRQILVVATDITERKQMQEDLEASLQEKEQTNKILHPTNGSNRSIKS